jgi:predicted CXXCH cytochrome family protein
MALLLPPQALADSARATARKRECSICHVAWLDAFARDDTATLIPYEPRPAVETGRQDVASTERMCFSCHDGFVLDSRAVWFEDRHNHPVGVKPSDKVQIPELFQKTIYPLNDDGKVYCGTCHSAHGLSWAEDPDYVFMRTANPDSSMCVACHEIAADENTPGNHPVFKELKSIPDKLVEAGSLIGNENEIICQSCHLAHSALSYPLLVVDNRQAGLCSQCHADKAGIVQSKHDLSVMAAGTENRKGQVAGESGPCLGCHLIHDADTSAPLWGRERASGPDPVTALCETCHAANGMAGNKVIHSHSHPTDVSVSALPKQGAKPAGISVQHEDKQGLWIESLPLYDAKGQRAQQGDRVTCLTCHDPHLWDPAGAIKANTAMAEGGGNTSFLRIAQGRESRLCTTCHLDKRDVLYSKHNLDLGGKDLRAKLEAHPEVKVKMDLGVCGVCHRAHNGGIPAMSTFDTEPGEGAIQTMCDVCHMRKGITAAKKRGKHSFALHGGMTNKGMQTSLPLFDKSGRRTPDGGIDCDTCHDPHRWDPRQRKSGGKASATGDGTAADSFLRIPADAESALCLDCHRDKRTLVGTDHDLRVTAPEKKNALGQTVEQAGICGQCHGVHRLAGAQALWGTESERAADLQYSLCLNCHNTEGIAAHKIPTRLLHPSQVLAWSNQVRAAAPARQKLPVTPVYDHRGRSTKVGHITCASCHDPHRWAPSTSSPGPGVNVEGDASNSFLRNLVSGDLVCADCHGRDAIFLYKYFHGLGSRQFSTGLR